MHIPSRVPLLPGHIFDDPYKTAYHKKQQFALKDGVMCEDTSQISENINLDLLDRMRTQTPCPPEQTRDAPENDYIPRIQAPWVKYDRQVLKFDSYFQESVVENKTENYRVRFCQIFYYLTDGTIHVTEPKIENSGIPQGLFINRKQIPKHHDSRSNEKFTWRDFNLSSNMTFYDRTFRVINCDDFTRQFMESHGVVLNGPEELPTDAFGYHTKIRDIKIPPPDYKEYKEYYEVALGGGHPNGGLDKYLTNDRKVLSFDIMWNDTTLCGGVNYYRLNYFLADGTIEVKEIRKQNNGKDPFPLLLRRSKLPMDPFLTHYPGMSLKKEVYYKPEDLICGNSVKIYNRPCLIYDCDEFTKKFYRDAFGVDQKPIELSKQKYQKYEMQIPPYNGYGSEEDSLGNCFSLMPKPPHKNLNKMFNCDQYILRFNARLLSENREDNNRDFIISFFCGDDTIQVYLKTERNSGITQGSYLARGRHKNNEGTFYHENDMQIGATISLNGSRFQLLSSDEFTTNYMKCRPNVFNSCDVNYVFSQIRNIAMTYPSMNAFAQDFVTKLDPGKEQHIDFEVLYNRLLAQGLKLTYSEAFTLLREYDETGTLKCSIPALFTAFKKFCNTGHS